jgi:hypothetical protein
VVADGAPDALGSSEHWHVGDAEHGEDLAQKPDARRQRVAVVLDRLDQQVQARGLLVTEVEDHCSSQWRSPSGWVCRLLRRCRFWGALIENNS